MPTTAADALAGTAAAVLVKQIEAAPHDRIVTVVRGVAGSGKSAVLDAIADTLQRRAIPVSRLVDADPGSALVIDDVHDLSSDDRLLISAAIARGDVSVFTASEPREFDRELHALLSDVPVLHLEPVDRDASYLRALLARYDGDVVAVLSVAGLGVTPDPDLVMSVAPQITRDGALVALDRARGSGLLDIIDRAMLALRSVVGDHRITAIQSDVIDVLYARGTLDADIVCAAAASGVRSETLVRSASALAQSTMDSRRLWEAALAAGATPSSIAIPFADACVIAGDFDAASRLVDSVLGDTADSDRLQGAVRIAASIASARGTATRSADLYRWLGPARVGSDAAVAALTLLAIGDRDGAAQFLTVADTGPPTSLRARNNLLAHALAQSMTASTAVALGSALRASSMSDGSGRAEPESAAAVAALLSLHGGDPAGAQAILDRAIGAESSPPQRLRLLDAWTSMTRGDLVGAQERIASMDPGASQNRDLLLLGAVRVGLARRRGDSGSLLAAWHDAASVIAEVEVDLFSLLPVGELWLAAVRIGDVERIEHLVFAAGALLTALGDPAVWTATWHWYGVQAAILAEDPSALLPHARGLSVAAESSSHAAGLAAAGRAWLHVLQGNADADEAESAAIILERFGLPWDGARLASEAALRVDDTASATALLQTARRIGAPTSRVEDSASGPLTDRESDVAKLLILGLTYREIGARLFISAKTVEHHVARIRRRLGAKSRSDMLSILRATGFSDEPSDLRSGERPDTFSRLRPIPR